MNFFQIASFGIYENFFMGIFHGILFSLPLSIPFLISLRYFVLQGLSFGFISLFGVLFGQFVFFVILCSGIRPLILLWYSLEPILAFVGVALTFRLATDFYHQKKFFDISTSEIGRARARSTAALAQAQASQSVATQSAGFPPGQALPLRSFAHAALKIFDRVGVDLSFSQMPFEKIKIFLFQFCLIFLNPVFPALSTRIILTQDILTHFSLLYTSGFFIGSILCVVSFLFFLQSLSFFFTRWKPLLGVDFAPRLRSILFSVDTFSQFVNNCFVFCIIGLLLHGSFQYTWRFITHYPFEFFSIPIRADNTNSNLAELRSETSPEGFRELTDGKQRITEAINSPRERSDATTNAYVEAKPVLDKKTLPYFSEFLREFPTQDSNIRHREKTLPVERHLPIERINLRRNLSGRPPLNEEQKSDASTKYNSFFLNKIENIFENFKIRSRENIRAKLTPEAEIVSLQSSGASLGLESDAGFASVEHSYTNAYVTPRVPQAERSSAARAKPSGSLGLVTPNIREAALNLQINKTKGKPQFSYIRHLFYNKTTSDYGPGTVKAATSNVSSHEIALNPYIHDDLSIYYALSKDGVEIVRPSLH